MPSLPVIAVFDVGKTNKKLFLMDEQYRIVWERTAKFMETEDEDGFPCEHTGNLQHAVFDSLNEIFDDERFSIKAVNFSAYGATFVYVDKKGNPVAPIYNYLKPYPEQLKKQFYSTYGGEEAFSYCTASPVLGSLNSGLQLYRIKYEQPDLFKRIGYALHLPQYFSYLLTHKFYADITSIGCHTCLWDFRNNRYHDWVRQEGLAEKLPPILASDHTEWASYKHKRFKTGVGLHDSSAALIPYLESFREPFVLISTGTWCISLNPFNHSPLTKEELKKDCLCYLTYLGKPVKASRLFAGHDHEEQVKRIATHFLVDPAWYRAVKYDPDLIAALQENYTETNTDIQSSIFVKRDLAGFSSADQAYHQLMLDIARQQFFSTRLVMKGSEVKKIFVDGGFSRNEIYMHLLASLFPGIEVYAASVAQATALGAALAIHKQWNKQPLSHNLIALQPYTMIHEPLV